MKNAKVFKWWSKHNIPDELWPEILSRLPVKSLLRFRCVSRSWMAWIDDPAFTRLHLNRFNNRSESQILFVHSQGQCVLKNSETLRTTLTLGFLQSDFETLNVLRSTHISGYSGVYRWSISSSLDGLFLLNGWTQLMLWNPSIRKMLTLPRLPPISLPQAEYVNVGFGLGFDPLIRDYKVVKFVSLPKKGMRFAAVYTLRTNTWKLVECPVEGREDLDFSCCQSSISFNGVLYGLARDSETLKLKLVLFDLRSEAFASFELPVADFNNYSNYCCLSIIDDGRSLALIHLFKSNVSIWTLEGLGDDDTMAWSWIQRYSFATVLPDHHYAYEFLCIKKNGEMLLKSKNLVACYNLESQERKILMEKNKKRFKAANMFTYKESLTLHS